MMRNDINFAIVEMVRANSTQTHLTLNSTNATSPTSDPSRIVGEFDWSTGIQSIILGSFYWCYVLSQVSDE